MDQDAIDHPEMIHVFSAGNNGNSDCQYGAGAGWGNITGGHKIAKNVVTVANLDFTDGIASSSSRGPAADGRIKPDIGAVGTQVYSTTDLPAPHSYTQKTGTSMSCPGVSGTLATLYQTYRETHGGQDPHAGILKAILMNTAEDLGNSGPDFIFGYGRIDARRAAEAIENNRFLIDSVSTGTQTFTIPQPVGNVREVRIMLYWPDAPASTNAARSLVNDLDLDVTVGGTSYDPWVLDPSPNPASLNTAAVRSRDSLNNIEQVTITDPSGGIITVDVTAFNVPTGTQQFFVTYEFMMDEVVLTYPVGGEGFPPTGTEYIRWDAPNGSGNFRLDYSLDGGSSWNLISSSINSTRRYAAWSVPNTPTANAKIRVIRGQDTAMSPGEFVIAGRPYGLDFPINCPDSLTLSWFPMNGATGYTIYQLGTQYMDSIGFTTDTSATIYTGNPTISTWYSVATTINGKAGIRAVAIQNAPGVYNCQLGHDVLLSSLISPLPGVSTDCFQGTGIPVKVRLKNAGLNDVFNFTVSYSFNGGPTVTGTVTDTIPAGASLSYTFPGSSLTLAPNTPYDMDLWVNYGADQNAYNDTISSEIFVENSFSAKTLPYFNDFEGFNNCNTTPDCGGTTCPLGDGWINVDNGPYDDIDFRTNDGTSPSQQTGPFEDHNPGTTTGNYLYLEASNGCDSSEAILLSPCLFVDTAATSPSVEFRYHMYGLDMGRLDVDLITENGVVTDVIPPVIGNNGNFWKPGVIDLTPYKNQNVVVRFRGKTGNGVRSDLALDDFSFYDAGIAPPAATFSISDSSGCTGDTLVFQTTSSDSSAIYNWDFGAGATPSTASTVGPHQVVYSFGGIKTTILNVSNSGGKNVSTIPIAVQDIPNASYSFSINRNTVQFNDASSFNPDSWYWDFGDGDTSNLASPTHTFPNIGTYFIQFTASNECGSNTYTDSITITSMDVGLEELALGYINLYPNPTTGQLHLDLSEEWRGSSVQVIDLSGKIIRKYAETETRDEFLQIDISDFKNGVYIIQVEGKKGMHNLRVIKKD